MHIKEVAYLVASSHQASDSKYTPESARWLIDVLDVQGDDVSKYEPVVRYIKEGASMVGHILSPDSTELVDTILCEERIKNRDNYAVVIPTPEKMKKSTAELFSSLSFEFVAMYALWKYCLLVAPLFVERIAAMKDDAKKELEKTYAQMGSAKERPYFPQF